MTLRFNQALAVLAAAAVVLSASASGAAAQSKKKAGPGDLEKLLNSGNTWSV